MIDAHLNAAAEPIAGNIAGYREHRRTIQPGAAYAGCKIGRPRTQRRNTNAGTASQVSNGGGHETGRRFASGENELHGALAQRFNQGKHRTAGHAENPAHIRFLQHAHNQITVFHFAVVTLLSTNLEAI